MCLFRFVRAWCDACFLVAGEHYIYVGKLGHSSTGDSTRRYLDILFEAYRGIQCIQRYEDSVVAAIPEPSSPRG